jgi:hypothetical protein
MRDHPDDETIAAFREDLLPAHRTARIAAHLAECPRCAEVDAQLAAVTAALARTPTPPMPASLTARLDAALAAEIAARSTAGASPAHADPAGDAAPAASAGPADRTAAADRTATPAYRGPGTGPEHTGPGHTGPEHTGPGHTGPGRGGPGRRRGRPRAGSRLSLRIASVAAAVVVLAGGGYAIARVVSAGGQETSASSSGAAASGGAESRPSGSALAPEAAPRVPAGLPLVASGTTYRADQLPAQVAAVLKRHPAAHGHVSAATPAAAGAAAFPHLDECVSYVAGGQRPRLVDIARYGTRPAAVIVVPVPGTATVRVSVVGPGCSGQGGDIIRQFSMPAPG